ncbi:MAG: type III-B CRISPR module-associated protein Cmr5 [Polyangiaceae bacterium]|nr:type III-B CRISPR module-associated protein Cmr5 [Polyangiaceae bacterium]
MRRTRISAWRSSASGRRSCSTRDQDRAALAYKHVEGYLEANEERQKKYATMIHKLPALLQTAGLCQALHFVHSRGGEGQKEIVQQFADQLQRVNPAIKTGDQLLQRARSADLAEYLQLTDEALSCAAWYRRIVQGVLKVEAGNSVGGD